MKIRKATADDIPRIKPLYRQIIARLYELAPLYRVDCEQEDEFIKKTIECESSEILVAEEDGGLLAFALLEGRETAKLAGVAPRRYAFLMDICVALRVPDGHMRRRKAARPGNRKRAARRLRRMGAREKL